MLKNTFLKIMKALSHFYLFGADQIFVKYSKPQLLLKAKGITRSGSPRPKHFIGNVTIKVSRVVG